MARQYSVYEAKAKLSELLRLVKSGQEVTVTERNQPIAKVIPFIQESLTLKDRLELLVQSGNIKKGKPIRSTVATPTNQVKGALARFLKDRNS